MASNMSLHAKEQLLKTILSGDIDSKLIINILSNCDHLNYILEDSIIEAIRKLHFEKKLDFHQLMNFVKEHNKHSLNRGLMQTLNQLAINYKIQNKIQNKTIISSMPPVQNVKDNEKEKEPEKKDQKEKEQKDKLDKKQNEKKQIDKLVLNDPKLKKISEIDNENLICISALGEFSRQDLMIAQKQIGHNFKFGLNGVSTINLKLACEYYIKCDVDDDADLLYHLIEIACSDENKTKSIIPDLHKFKYISSLKFIQQKQQPGHHDEIKSENKSLLSLSLSHSNSNSNSSSNAKSFLSPYSARHMIRNNINNQDNNDDEEKCYDHGDEKLYGENDPNDSLPLSISRKLENMEKNILINKIITHIQEIFKNNTVYREIIKVLNQCGDYLIKCQNIILLYNHMNISSLYLYDLSQELTYLSANIVYIKNQINIQDKLSEEILNIINSANFKEEMIITRMDIMNGKCTKLMKLKDNNDDASVCVVKKLQNLFDHHYLNFNFNDSTRDQDNDELFGINDNDWKNCETNNKKGIENIYKFFKDSSRLEGILVFLVIYENPNLISDHDFEYFKHSIMLCNLNDAFKNDLKFLLQNKPKHNDNDQWQERGEQFEEDENVGSQSQSQSQLQLKQLSFFHSIQPGNRDIELLLFKHLFAHNHDNNYQNLENLIEKFNHFINRTQNVNAMNYLLDIYFYFYKEFSDNVKDNRKNKILYLPYEYFSQIIYRNTSLQLRKSLIQCFDLISRSNISIASRHIQNAKKYLS